MLICRDYMKCNGFLDTKDLECGDSLLLST